MAITIVSSEIVSQVLQDDGRAWITERFVDSAGTPYVQRYLAAVGTDLAAVLSSHAVSLAEDLNSMAVPQQITALQARRALNQQGLRTQVENAVAAASQDVKDAWQFAGIYNRTDPIISTMAAALNWSASQVDDLFTLAATFTQ